MGSTVKKITKPLSSIFPGLDEAAGQIFPDAPKIPGQEKPLVAPDPDDEEAARASSRASQRRKRSGRTSTVLSEGSKLG